MRPIPADVAVLIFNELGSDHVWLVNEGQQTVDMLMGFQTGPGSTAVDLLKDWEAKRGGKIYATVESIISVMGEAYRHAEISGAN